MRHARALYDGEFFRRYPDEAACLDALMRRRFGPRPLCPACGCAGPFAPVAGRTAWRCAVCRHQLYPGAGTPFAGSRVPLRLWFYAAFWSVHERRVPSARRLQQRLGVGYATAWRIAREIRRHFAASWPA